MAKLKLWSLRYSVARGKYWSMERECETHNAQEWLQVYMKDEPEIVFSLSYSKPKKIN